MGTIVVPFAGLNVTKSKIQIRRIEMTPTGMAMKNHIPQDGCGSIIANAIIFCGEAIGESIPPIFEERAIPRINALDILESDGRLRSIGLKR